MSSTTVPQGAPLPGLKRRAIPVVAIAIVVALIAVLWALPPDNFERGLRVMLTFIGSMLLMLVLGVWFFLLAGVSTTARLIALGSVIAITAVAVGSVRRVEFSGDMEPTFDLRWQPSREALLEERLAEQKAAPAIPAETVQNVERLANPKPEDSPQYRGIHRDGVVIGPRLARDWEQQPPKLLWRQPCGGGYAGFAVVGDLAITIEQRRDDEAVVAYDLPRGRELWAHSYSTLFSERLGGDGPRATPAIADGRVYSLGAAGELVCLDPTTGKLHWQVNILKENGAANIEWGMSGSPLVENGVVIVNPGTQSAVAGERAPDSGSVMALDATTGNRRWQGGSGKASYASPALVTLRGTPTILIFDAVGLTGYDQATGKELWQFPWTSDFDINAAQPVVIDDARVLISSAAGCTLLELSNDDSGWKVTPKWRNRWMKCSYSNPIAHGGHLYGLDEGILACINIETGERPWKKGRYGHGQILLSGDLILVLSEKGELALVEAVPTAFKEVARIQAIDGKTWNNPVLIGNRALVRNHLEMACYELPVESPPPATP